METSLALTYSCEILSFTFGVLSTAEIVQGTTFVFKWTRNALLGKGEEIVRVLKALYPFSSGSTRRGRTSLSLKGSPGKTIQFDVWESLALQYTCGVSCNS